MSLEDSTPHTPIFFILSPGSDPTKSVEVMAKNKFGDITGKLHRIALGEGQDVVAMSALDLAHREGHWVVLENIHLMPAWTYELEKKLDEFVGDKTHDEFRVFLSAEPSDLLPIGLLERSIKLTNEPPTGLKPNLKRAFATLLEKDPKNPDVVDFEFKDPKAKMILFGLCHFHAVIIERIRYGTKGWNRAYPFNTGDLQNCNTVLSNYFDGGNDKIPWKDLQYIFGEILYGGHITDNSDRLLCLTYLDYFLRDSMLDEMELFPFNESFPEEQYVVITTSCLLLFFASCC
jgi:dynein heavy chain